MALLLLHLGLIQELRDMGVLNSERQLVEFQQQLSNLPGSPMGHLPGPLRVQNLINCAYSNRQKTCRTELVPETYVTYESVNRPVQGECGHWIQTPYGPRRQHQFDWYPNWVTVPVERTRMKQIQVCD